MGRASITGGGPNGFYSIEIDTGSQKVAATIAEIEARIAGLQADIIIQTAAYEVALDLEQDDKTALAAAIDAYIAALEAGGEDGAKAELDAMNKATEAYARKSAQTKAELRELNNLKLTLKSAQKELEKRQAIVTTLSRGAWCADLTEDGGGNVATIEIPGERSGSSYILVAPGCVAPSVESGQLITRPAMTGPQAYFNAAVLPGWQRWMPTYRAGVAGAINYGANTMNVSLYDLPSSAQALGINQVSSLSDVPVNYMTCHAYAFNPGDEVVVAFAGDWTTPTVIGFLHDPKGCGCIDGVSLFIDFAENYGDLVESDTGTGAGFYGIPESLGWQFWSTHPFGDPWAFRFPTPANEGGLLKFTGFEACAPIRRGNYLDYAPTVDEWLVLCAKASGAKCNRIEWGVTFDALFINYGGVQTEWGAEMTLHAQLIAISGGTLWAAINQTVYFTEGGQSKWYYLGGNVNIACPSRGGLVVRIDLNPYWQRLYINNVLIHEVIGYHGFGDCAVFARCILPTAAGNPTDMSDGNLSTIDYVYFQQV